LLDCHSLPLLHVRHREMGTLGWPLHRDVDLSVLDRDRVRDHADLLVAERAAGLDVVLPAVPGAAQDLALAPVLELVDLRGQGRAGHLAEAAPRARVDADVLERVVGAVQVEDADLAALDLEDLAPARWDVLDSRDWMPVSHRLSCPHA